MIGARSGAIYEAIAKNGQFDLDDNPLSVILDCHDGQQPQSIDSNSVHSYSSNLLFFLSKTGLFSVTNLDTHQILYKKSYNKEGQYIYSFKTCSQVMIVFEREIIVLAYDIDACTFDQLEPFSKRMNVISAIKMDKQERILAVGT
jgi:hypothetical protein